MSGFAWLWKQSGNIEIKKLISYWWKFAVKEKNYDQLDVVVALEIIVRVKKRNDWNLRKKSWMFRGQYQIV